MAVTALAPWFGSNRMLASQVGKALKGCEWVGVAFAGGMCEVRYIPARTILVNDLHRDIINLATIVSSPTLGPKLYRTLRRIPVHNDALKDAQNDVKILRRFDGIQTDEMRLRWAATYFVAVWMGRSGKAGTKDELKGNLAFRFDAGGGDSAVRYHSAVRSIPEFRNCFRRCTFSTFDVFEFLDKCLDRKNHGIYCDAPFPGPGDAYLHTFDEAKHRQLAKRLTRFRHARVICRFYDVPLIREIYPEPHWTYRPLVGRKATNAPGPELLISNQPEAFQ